MIEAELIRSNIGTRGILGEMTVRRNNVEAIVLQTLERPWLDNQHVISCVPSARYQVIWNVSRRFGSKFSDVMPLLEFVPNRAGVRIHPGNTVTDSDGCILVGLAVAPTFSKDGWLYSSRLAYRKLYDFCRKEPFTLSIVYPM